VIVRCNLSRGGRKIDAAWFAVSLRKNSRNSLGDAVCTHSHQLPACFAQMTGEIRDISAKMLSAPQ
jgi:hypothetical protein